MKIASIAIGCDHAGFDYKDALIDWARQAGHVVQDFGTHSTDSVDYPDFVHPVANAVSEEADTWGILLCGSANGVAITANKHQDVRAAIASLPALWIGIPPWPWPRPFSAPNLKADGISAAWTKSL
jgi:ribose 5-phosphate isomerase B